MVGQLDASVKSRSVRFGFFVLLVVIATGCQAQLDVVVDVEEDGSGIVELEATLDEEASDAVLDLRFSPDSAGLPLTDLVEAGWLLDPPQVDSEGATRVGAQKAFGTPEQFAQVMAELSGDSGLFDDFRLERNKEFSRVNYLVTGTIQPGGLEPFADDALTQLLGRPVTAIAEQSGGSASDVDVELRVRMVGELDRDDISTGDPVGDSDRAERVWLVNLAETEPVPVVAASSVQAVAPLFWRGVAIVAGVLAGLVLLGHLLRVLRPERRRSSDRPRPPARARPAPAEVAEDLIDADDVVDAPQVVALDGMGVLYREGSDISELLVPFAREMGSESTAEEIAGRARSLSLGRITPADFWQAIGLNGNPNELDDLYLSRHQLSPGVVQFLRDLKKRNIRVACITNDSTAWANKLKARHSLDGLIDPWVVSGAVGVRKPDRPIYEVLRRVVGRPANAIMIVDDELANLDAARELGFRTAWYAPNADPAGARGHAILRSFSVEAPV